jgi:carbon monoxide dehydrogenase subunit G
VRFEGTFTLPLPVDQAWLALQAVETVSGCLPGAEGVRQLGPDRYSGQVRVRLGPIQALFDLTGTVQPDGATRTLRVDLQGRERLTGTLVEGTFVVRLEPVGQETRGAYALDLVLRGKLSQLGQAVYQDVAQRMTRETITCLQSRLSAAR